MLTIKENEVKDLAKNYPVFLLFFTSPKCSACEQFRPFLNEVIRLHRDIPMREISIFKAEELATEMEVTGVPYLAVYQNGECVGGGATSNQEGILALIDYLKQDNDKYQEAELCL